MFLEVDAGSAVPPYEQLRAQLAGFIGSGTLTPGTRLPAIRKLAGDLGVAAGTVARAYRELEHAGLIQSHGRHGTRVADSPPRVEATPTRAQLDEAAATFAAAAARGGHDVKQALDAVRRAFTHIDSAAQAELGEGPPVPVRVRTVLGLERTITAQQSLNELSTGGSWTWP